MFKVRDVVFARLEGYPFWPARVIAPEPQHLANLGMHKIPPNHHLVLFYNDSGRYAAMATSDLRNFDDPRIQRRTLEHEGAFRAQLRTAFEEALQEHSNNNSSPTNSPQQKQKRRLTKIPPTDLTSPVTGHSESRQPKNAKRVKHLPHRPNSTSHSPPQPPPRETPRPHNMTSRTHPDSSPATRPSEKKLGSPQIEPSASVQLRLPLKRNSALLKPSSQSGQPASDKSVTKRRRLVKSDHSNVPEHSEKQTHTHRPTQHKSHTSNDKNQTAQPHQRRHKHKYEKLTLNPKRRPRVSDDPDRIPRLTNRKTSHLPDEKRQRKPDSTPTAPKSHLERNESGGSGSEELVVLDGSAHDSDRVPCSKKRKRSSKDTTYLSDDSNSDSEPPRKERRPASKRSLSVERPRLSHELQAVSVGNSDVREDCAEKEVENPTSIESEKKGKPDTGLTDRLTAFDHLTRGECIDLIHHLQETIRRNHVELWRRGIKLAEEKDVLKTEKELVEACRGAVQKAENVFKLMKNEKKDKKEVEEREAEACRACYALLDIYFDYEKMSMKVLPNRILELVEQMRCYSTKLSRVLLDVVVLWADLFGEKIRTGNKDGTNKKVESKQRSVEKKESKTDKGIVSRKVKTEKGLSPRKVKTEKELSPRKVKTEKGLSPRKVKTESVGKNDDEVEKASTPKKVDKSMKRSAPKKESDKAGMRSTPRKEDDNTVKRSSQKKEEDKIARRVARKKDDESEQESRERESEKGEKESGLNKDESTEKGSAERKKALTRQERLQKFDRKSCCNAMESLFKQDGKPLKLDEEEVCGITKRVEREIRPKFEDDKEGYYDASANVIRGLRKALRYLAAKRDKNEDKKAASIGVSAHASLLKDAIRQQDREKAKELVSQLNGR